MARERNQALQIPDGGGAKQRPAERVAQQVNRSKPRGQGRRPAMAVGLRAARENGGGAGDKAETQREARLHEKSGSVRPRPGCLAQVAVLPEASAAYLSGRDGDLGGRANSVDSDRQSNVGGRTMATSVSRLPDARPGMPICSAQINSIAPLIHGKGRRPGGSPVCHWPQDTRAWLVDSRDSVVEWSSDSDSQRSPEPPAPRASLEAAIGALAFQRLSVPGDPVCTAGGGRCLWCHSGHARLAGQQSAAVL